MTSSIVKASKKDFCRVLDDCKLLTALGATSAVELYNENKNYHLVTHRQDEMIVEYKYSRTGSLTLMCNVLEAHIACPRRCIKSVRIMCKDYMILMANRGLDIIITDCIPGTTSNTAVKLGFKFIEQNDRGRFTYLFPIHSLRQM